MADGGWQMVVDGGEWQTAGGWQAVVDSGGWWWEGSCAPVREANGCDKKMQMHMECCKVLLSTESVVK